MQNSQVTNAEIIEERITKVNGDFHIKRYARGKLLGTGGFAKVYNFTNLENKKILAGKIMPKANLSRSRTKQKLMSEIRLHKSLHHHNIVKFEHVFEDHDNVYILLELCSNQSMIELLKRRKRLTEFEVQCYILQIIEALQYLQANRIIHRDLKLGNLFLSDKMQIKLGDFGLAAKLEFDGEKKRTVCGTPNYIAPEVIDGNSGHSYQADVWALGVIAYTLLIGKPPFETTEVKLTYKRIKAADFSFPETAPISQKAEDLIRKILVINPEKRLTLEEIILHPFINNGQSIPPLMPVSTLACPPTTEYMKHITSTSITHIKSECESLDTFDVFRSPKNAFTGSSRILMALKTPTAGENIQFDFLKMTPKTPGNSNFFGPDRFGLHSNPGVSKEKELGSAVIDQIIPQGLLNDKFRNVLQPKENIEETVGERYKNTETKHKLTEIKEVWVVKWYDYTNKYGLGYGLSNGTIGVSFNEGTKLITNNTSSFDFIERNNQDKNETRRTYSFKKYPSQIHKQVLIYDRFKEYFQDINKFSKDQDNSIYVKKWIKTKHAILFRFNNRVLQASFNDKTTLIINSETKKVTYVDKKEDVLFTVLEDASVSDNKDLAKRLKYTEEVLKHIWTAQTDHHTDKKSQDVVAENNVHMEDKEMATSVTS